MTAALTGASLPSIADLIPHRPPMVFATSLARSDEQGAAVCCEIGANSLAARPDGTVEPLALLEIIAQACAAYGGLRMMAFDRPKRAALLAGFRSFEILGPARVGIPMEATVTLTKEFGECHLFYGVLRQEGRELARADVKAFHPPEKAGDKSP